MRPSPEMSTALTEANQLMGASPADAEADKTIAIRESAMGHAAEGAEMPAIELDRLRTLIEALVGRLHAIGQGPGLALRAAE